MRAAVVQEQFIPGDVVRNVSTIVRYIQQAAEQSCSLVVFPEMCDTGYDMQLVGTAAGSWDGSHFRKITTAAATAKITVVCGLSERTTEHIYNTVAVIGPDGRLITKYRKIHLITAAPIHEERTITAGHELCLFDSPEFSCGVMTCYDIRFPEIARSLAVQGAELIIVPAAFPASRIDHWRILTEARAIENQAFVIACNRAGTDAEIDFGGHSRIISPSGRLVASASATECGMLTAEIDRKDITGTRNTVRVFQDRREDLYRHWSAFDR